MKLSQRGISLVMMLGLLGVAGGIAYVSSKGLIKANKAVVKLDEKLELNGISRSTLAYARYILRERKCFKIDDHTELTKDCKLNSAGNLERILLAESTAAVLGKGKGLSASKVLLRELTLTIPSKSIISGHPLYGPLNDSKVKVDEIKLKFNSRKKRELGNTSSEVLVTASFYNFKKEEIYNAYVKYLLMPRHVNTYAFAVKGNLSLGSDKSNSNSLNSNIEFLSPIFVSGDVNLPKRGTSRSVATGAKFRDIEHGGDVKEGSSTLFTGASGFMSRWSDDKRLGNSFDFGSFKKVATEPAIDYIFSEKASAAAEDITKIGEKMQACLDYVKRRNSSAPTYNSRLFAKSKDLSSKKVSFELGISKLNEYKETSVNASSQIENDPSIIKPSIMHVQFLNRKIELARNDRYELRLASFIEDKSKADTFLKSDTVRRINDKVEDVYRDKVDSGEYKDELDKLQQQIRLVVEDNTNNDDRCKRITGEDTSAKQGDENYECNRSIKTDLSSGPNSIAEIFNINMPSYKNICKDKYDNDPGVNKIDECTLEYSKKVISKLERFREGQFLDPDSPEYKKAYVDAVSRVVTDKIIFTTDDKKTSNGNNNKYSFNFKQEIKDATNSWRKSGGYWSKLALYQGSNSNEIFIRVYNNRSGNNGKIDTYGGPNSVWNYITRLDSSQIRFNHSGSFATKTNRGNGYRCLSTNSWKCHWLSQDDLDSFNGKAEDMRADCLGDAGKIQDISASEDVSFLEKSFHSWNFNPKTKLHQFKPGVDSGFDYTKALKRNINLEGSDDIPQNSLYVQASNSKVFHVYSVLDHCRIDESAETFFGFVVCRTFVIEDRKKPLKIYGTIVADRINISPGAKITWGNVYHPNAAIELRKAKILRSISSNCSRNAKVPVWHSNPTKRDLDAIKSCQSVDVTEKADPFKWTSFNPECGIVDAKDATTKCKAIDRSYKYREYIIVEGQNENI